MRADSQSLLARRGGRIGQTGPAFFVLCLGLVISLFAWHATVERVGGEIETGFQYEVAEAVSALDRRVHDHVNLLIGLRGLFLASNRVERDEFQKYIAGFDIIQRFPGMRSVSFVRYVPHLQKDEFENSVRRDRSLDPRGNPAFAIYPPGDRDEYMVVTFIEPLAGHERALGLDVFSEPRRLTVERARDSGEATASEPIHLVSDPEKPLAVALRMPIYRRDAPTGTIDERRAAFVGFLASVIRVDAMVGNQLSRQLGNKFDLVIRDLGDSRAGARPSDPLLVLDSRRAPGYRAGPQSEGAVLNQVRTLDVAGRTWQLNFSSAPAPAYGSGRLLPPVILLGGMIASLLLSWLVLMLSLARERALKLAEQTTAARAAESVQEQLAFIQQLIEAVPQPIFFKDAAERRYLGVNKAWETFFGIPRERFIGKTVFELYPHDRELAQRHHAKDEELFSRPGSQSYEAAIVGADGRVHHTIYNKATFAHSNGAVAGLIGTITDVTGLKEAEAALRESEARFRGLTELSTDWYWEQDTEFRFTRIEGRTAGSDPVATREFLIGKTRWAAAADPLTGTWDDHRRQLEARQPFYDFEMRAVDGEGHERFLSTSGRPFFDAGGLFQGYRGSARDITARKREERLLKLEHSVTRSLAEAESASVGLKAVIRSICETQSWECGRYFGWNTAAGMLSFGECWHVPDAGLAQFIENSRGLTYAPADGLVGQVFQSAQPLWVIDISKDPRLKKGIARDVGMHGTFLFPAMSEGKPIGVLSFHSKSVREPDERLLDAIRVIGSQIGQFLQRKQAEEVLHKSEAQFRDLTELSSDWYWEQDTEFRFNRIEGRMPGLDPDTNRDFLIGKARWEAQGELLAGTWDEHRRLLEARQPFYDLELRAVDGEGRERFLSTSGRPFFDASGVFQGYRGTSRDITARKHEERLLKLEHSTTRCLAEAESTAVGLKSAIRIMCEILGWPCGRYFYADVEAGVLRFGEAWGLAEPAVERFLAESRTKVYRMGEGLSGQVWQSGSPLWSSEASKDLRSSGTSRSSRGVLGGALVFPVISQGTTIGVLSLSGHEFREPDERLLDAIRVIGSQIGQFLQRKQAEEKIQHMAQHDALTGLPNRPLLLDRIGQAIAQVQRKRGVLALLFLDLDRFKTVNDSLGHQVGDHLLQSVAGRLEACTRGSDTVARIGGDEFVVLLSELEQPEDAHHVAQKILDALSEPVTIGPHELKVTPSVGICAYPHDGEDVESLMRNADTAMYHAKQMGRNNFQFFTQEMNDAAQQRLRLENDLRRALERGEFTLHYQPLLDLESGAIVGFEALIRWPHPAQGMIPPAQFIPVAEDTGLIVPIGEWVLRHACAQARAWHDAGHKELRVAVNCSARQFQREDFVQSVARVLRETGLAPEHLDLEITEGVIVHHSEEVMARFEALDDMGVRISIDDFGTGYSSLGYLKRFAIHQLKVDQSFVRDISSDPDDAAIVSAIIAIAHSLELEVIAEGVETAEQLSFLKALGCARAQGYYFSKPLPADEFAKLLGGWRQRALAAAGA